MLAPRTHGRAALVATGNGADAAHGRVALVATETPADTSHGRVALVATETPADTAHGRVALVATGNGADAAHGRVALVATGTPADTVHGRVALVATENGADAAATSAALPSAALPRAALPPTDDVAATSAALPRVALPNAALPQLPQRRHPSRNSVMTHLDNRAIMLYVTVVTGKRNAMLADKAVQDCIVAAWKAAADWLVGRYVIMPDHIHFFCAPATYPPPDFHRWMKQWKAQVSRSFPIGLRAGRAHGRVALVATGNGADAAATSAALPPTDDAAATSAALPPTDDAAATSAVLPNVPLSRPPPLFQRDCWDRQLRTGESYAQKWEYVRNNPVRKGLVAHADEWPYQGQVNVLEWHERT